MNLNLLFPQGSVENYTAISELPSMPQVGDFIESSRPEITRYRVRALIYEVSDDPNEDSKMRSSYRRAGTRLINSGRLGCGAPMAGCSRA